MRHVLADRRLVPDNFITSDFLRMKLNGLTPMTFDAIVGNPPYVRHHWLKGDTRKAASDIAEMAPFNLSGRSSLWAYFIAHAMRFLSSAGRFAFVLPESLLQSEYGRNVLNGLTDRFALVRLIRVHQRLFEDTDEAITLLAAEGHGPGKTVFTQVENVEEARVALCHRTQRSVLLGPNFRVCQSSQIAQVLGRLTDSNWVVRLGDIAKAGIGIVTGDSHFFLMSAHDASDLSLPKGQFAEVVSKARHLRGLTIDRQTFEQLIQEGARALLPQPSATRLPRQVKAWIERGVGLGVDRRFKCRIRDPWYLVPLGPVPHAFVTCARGGAPRLVLNQAGIRCTNTLHALRWLRPFDPKAITVGFLTSLTALTAELYGRRYGGGVLKLEPSDVENLLVPIARITAREFEGIDRMLRAGSETAARQLADQLTLRSDLRVSESEYLALSDALSDLGRQRTSAR
jgi:hypothetical protein